MNKIAYGKETPEMCAKEVYDSLDRTLGSIRKY
ncbi:hypothetical protein B0H69_000540 [Clostridium beijerinckii]|nr:hypothetical protein [Clostridium beijerinckii]NRU51075.1 hypothetical protein [Clostridium beijerinckii]NRZ30782.1 hypothetical protein [Clostridium beijerinckii]NSA15356.1 hypothetical protein [Clostridium beijerinckii]NSA59817.1 hypothetical protein [Clostridium beijerinckii]